MSRAFRSFLSDNSDQGVASNSSAVLRHRQAAPQVTSSQQNGIAVTASRQGSGLAAGCILGRQYVCHSARREACANPGTKSRAINADKHGAVQRRSWAFHWGACQPSLMTCTCMNVALRSAAQAEAGAAAYRSLSLPLSANRGTTTTSTQSTCTSEAWVLMHALICHCPAYLLMLIGSAWQ